MFGRLVQFHRQQSGLTQEELAARSGLGVRTIRAIEADEVRTPRPTTVRLLAAGLGLDGPGLDRFRRHASGRGEPVSSDLPASSPPPAQLPGRVAAFTGRGEELRWLDTMLGDDRAAPVVVLVSGQAGVGKTALVVHWGSQVRKSFPDGQIYVNLRGYDPEASLGPLDALGHLLAALGVPEQKLPAGLEERGALYRTTASGRRILVVLDNAGTVADVRPLLAGSGSCLTVVTSRDSLGGLVARDGAYRLDLDVLPAGDCLTLLRTLLGGRVEAEPVAAASLVELCGRLPLAVRIAAELAASRRTSRLADLVAELADQRRRLDVLDTGGDPYTAVSAVFSWSIPHLPPRAVDVFTLLGLHPAEEFDGGAATALAGGDVTGVRKALAALCRAHLVHETGPDRYSMHDLLRDYAIRLAARRSDDERRAAFGRLADHYVAVSAAATDLLYPAEAGRRPAVGVAATPLPTFTDIGDAQTWLDRTRPCLVSIAAAAVANGRPETCGQLSAVLFRYLTGERHSDAYAVHGHALDAAVRTGDVAAEGYARMGLGSTHWQRGNLELAAVELGRAVARLREAGDRTGVARATGNLGAVEMLRSNHATAAEHLHRARALHRQAGDRLGEAINLATLGDLEERLGDLESAVARHREAMRLARECGDVAVEALALSNLGDAAQKTGDLESSLHHFERAFALYRWLGRRSNVAWSASGVGDAHVGLGRPVEGAAYLRLALETFRELGTRDGQAWTHNGLGEAAAATGDHLGAVTHYATALTIATEIGLNDQRARAHSGLARAYDKLGDPYRAAQHRRAVTNPDAVEETRRPEKADISSTGPSSGPGR